MNLSPGRHGGDGPAIAKALGLDPASIIDLSQSMNPAAPDVAAFPDFVSSWHARESSFETFGLAGTVRVGVTDDEGLTRLAAALDQIEPA